MSLTENKMNRIKHVWDMEKTSCVGAYNEDMDSSPGKLCLVQVVGSLECQDHAIRSRQVKASQR